MKCERYQIWINVQLETVDDFPSLLCLLRSLHPLCTHYFEVILHHLSFVCICAVGVGCIYISIELFIKFMFSYLLLVFVQIHINKFRMNNGKRGLQLIATGTWRTLIGIPYKMQRKFQITFCRDSIKTPNLMHSS